MPNDGVRRRNANLFRIADRVRINGRYLPVETADENSLNGKSDRL